MSLTNHLVRAWVIYCGTNCGTIGRSNMSVPFSASEHLANMGWTLTDFHGRELPRCPECTARAAKPALSPFWSGCGEVNQG